MTESQLRDAIVAHGKSLYDRGYAHGSSGNLSARDGVLVTPTGSSLGRLDPARPLLPGLVCGAISGAIVIYGRLQRIVATIATGAIYFGIALPMRSVPGGDIDSDFSDAFTGRIFGVVPRAWLRSSSSSEADHRGRAEHDPGGEAIGQNKHP